MLLFESVAWLFNWYRKTRNNCFLVVENTDVLFPCSVKKPLLVEACLVLLRILFTWVRYNCILRLVNSTDRHPLFCPEAVIMLVSTKNSDLLAGAKQESLHCRTSRQMWPAWLAENTKRILCACSENRVCLKVATFGADFKGRSLFEWRNVPLWLVIVIDIYKQKCL